MPTRSVRRGLCAFEGNWLAHAVSPARTASLEHGRVLITLLLHSPMLHVPVSMPVLARHRSAHGFRRSPCNRDELGGSPDTQVIAKGMRCEMSWSTAAVVRGRSDTRRGGAIFGPPMPCSLEQSAAARTTLRPAPEIAVSKLCSRGCSIGSL